MTYFAKIENNIVVSVIVAEQDFIDTLPDKEKWIETFDLPIESNPRLYYAAINYTYEIDKDRFIPIKNYNSWIWDETSKQWVPPIPLPEDNMYMDGDLCIGYIWDEETVSWKKVERELPSG
jgi:hypothetical protein